jgi:hypothetical protein
MDLRPDRLGGLELPRWNCAVISHVDKTLLFDNVNMRGTALRVNQIRTVSTKRNGTYAQIRGTNIMPSEYKSYEEFRNNYKMSQRYGIL